MIKNVIFDLDGTIADSFDKFIAVLRDIPLSPKIKSNLSDEIIEKYRNSDPVDILKSLHISFFRLPFYIRKILKGLKDYNENVSCFSEIEHVLRKLKESGFFLGVISSNNLKNIYSFLEKNNIAFFDSILTSGLFSKSSSIKKMIKKNNLNLSETIYVGDETRDIKASKQAGIKVISVTWGFQTKKVIEVNNPDFIADTPKDILNIITQVN